MRRTQGFKTLFLALLIASAACIGAIADNTLRGRRLHTTPASRDALLGLHAVPTVPCDTLMLPSRDSIQLSGYDKPLRTNRETLLLTNSTSRALCGLSLTITYVDMQGRQLHSRTDTLRTSLPPGETRMLRLSTWDTQQSYYYHLSRRPRTTGVTPYDVKCRVEFAVFKL